MISRILMVGVLVGGLFYLYNKNVVEPPPPPPPPPKPPVMDKPPPQVVNEDELDKIRLATKDADKQVRWAAIELLVRMHDPYALETLEESMRIDTEPEVRRNALNLLKDQGDPDRAQKLTRALMDTERDIRMAALLALAEIADPATAPAIVKALIDTEPTVRTQALHTLGIIQAKQDAEHKQMQEEVRRAYEEAVKQHEMQTTGKGRPRGLETKHKDLMEKNPE
jgi:HEAT repeat protein